jgi:hypothetical protein
MSEVLIGREAIARGVVTRHELQRWYRPLFPGVHAAKGVLTLRDRTMGAWLWSRRRAVIAGVAASALHGAQWVDDDQPVELIWNCTRPPRGILTRNEILAADEITEVTALPVTSLARTAFDLGRHLPRSEAIKRMDALMWATPFGVDDVLRLAECHRGVRGVRRLKAALPLVDCGAASPRETWLRLLLVDAGLPRPRTQIPVYDGWRWVRVLDMGWEEVKVAVEYDGDQHRTDRKQYAKDIRSTRTLERLGWIVIRVIKEDRPEEIIESVRAALIRRGLSAAA